MLSSFLKRFRRDKKPKWKCTSCGATCVTIKDLVCGEPDRTVIVYYDDGFEVEHSTSCPLDYIEN